MTGVPEPFALAPSSLDPRLRRPADLEEWQQQSPNRRSAKGKRVNIPLPVPRPTNDSNVLPLTQGFDDAAPKAAQIVTEVNKIGPAATAAAQQVATGMRSAVDEAIADVGRLQRALDSLRPPSGIAAGKLIGGFNTGKSMREIE
jgi:hypothetical protein